MLFVSAPDRPRSFMTVAVLAPCLLLTLGLVWALTRDLTRPLLALEARAEEMSRGELASPVAFSGEGDEIGRLTFAFEEMRRALRDRLRTTESVNIDLEREVRRRTEALEEKNRQLQEALDKLRRAQDDLVRSEKLTSMGRLVAGIAHEINNPVNAIINSLAPLQETIESLQNGEKVTAPVAETAKEATEMLSVIARGANRTKAIVQALHNYSRGEDSLKRVVNLRRAMTDTLDLLRHKLRDVQVEVQVPDDLQVMGYSSQMDQVLMNLTANALAAMEKERAGQLRIIGALVPVDPVDSGKSEVCLTISDSGNGISPDVLPRIFDPFFTTKDVGQGSGLGLSIVHSIVERHGGRIEVQSTLGQGTTFTLRFPDERFPNEIVPPHNPVIPQSNS